MKPTAHETKNLVSRDRAARPGGAEPFLRWAGGKRWATPLLTSLIPAQFGRYFEPFLGGGALFFSVAPKEAVLADSNADLIQMYECVRDNHTRIAELVQSWKNSKTEYYRIRESNPKGRFDKAARFLYLNRTCWNGLYRVNQRGHFNVPYGSTQDRSLLNGDALRRAADALSNVELRTSDFEGVIEGAQAGDVVYLDPPYTGMHSNNGFVRYNERLFSWDDQVRLANKATEVAERGCTVIISNANHPEIVGLYDNFQTIPADRSSRIAGDSKRRGTANEIVLVSPARRRADSR
jgi:DNA adenine methylase